ncbi:hypothetical protein SAMN05421841_1320 [Chryseobacterium wanjuense]|jgi:hypothetical protein|uniref:Uncharacterized protein n=1 Tax=Chryseobacterium wanjuense TaxID=356305 RepID=A0A1I0PNK6_9FLAO|nr:hypothetical protein [Chryseobacterium wanjuense]SEW15932.1 hypothetical protein SAMN05421841_1320 [Chryseobacterium wanjuense]
MKTKKILSPILGEHIGTKGVSKGIENAAKYVAVGFLALFALGLFTTSQKINAG